MTVCVATISNGMIIGASDRMITSGDIEFEPDNLRKEFVLTPSMRVLWAGDAGLQLEVLRSVERTVAQRVAQEPENWWAVRDVVDVYINAWRAAKSRRAEVALLAPLGLTIERLIRGEHGLSSENVKQLASLVIGYQLPGEAGGPLTEAIIAGIDQSAGAGYVAAHMYRVVNDEFTCVDGTAFAAIGSGAWHANSQLMLAGYGEKKPITEALWLTYLAKRRAEVAPGVGGNGTNMFMIGSSLGFYREIPLQWIQDFDRMYDGYRAAEKRENASVLKEVGDWLAKTVAQASSAQDDPGPLRSGDSADAKPPA